ncbi:hypothetical protein VPH35_045185 [Triticum aestivum]
MDGVAVPHQETNPHAIPDPHLTSFLLIFLPWWWRMWLGECVDLGDLVDSSNAVMEMSRENVGCTGQSCQSWRPWMLGLRRHRGRWRRKKYQQDVSIFCEWRLILALLLSGLLPNVEQKLACSIFSELSRQAKLSVCTTVERSVICLHPLLQLFKLQKQGMLLCIVLASYRFGKV